MKNVNQLTSILTCLLFLLLAQSTSAQPPNDECSGAIDISYAFVGACGDVTFNGPFDLTGSTPGIDDPPEPGEQGICPNETDPNLFGDAADFWENSIWYTWTVPDLNGDGSPVTYSLWTTDGSYRDDCGITYPLGGDSDTQVAIYEGPDCPDSTTGECDHYAANEDLFTVPPWISGWLNIDFTPGVTYYMGVDGWDGVQGEFCLTVVTCGVECGDGDCAPVEEYCDCQGDCPCTFGDIAAIEYDDGFFFSEDLTGNIFLCSEFVNGFPSDNVFLSFGAQNWTDCSGYTSAGIDITISAGQIIDGAIDNGDGTFNIPTGFVLYLELTPAEIAAGSVTVAASVPDGLGGFCEDMFTINFADFPQATDPYCELSCSAGGVDTGLLDNGITVCEGETFTLSTDGLEDLTLPCSSDDGSSYVYAWRVLIDLYGTGDYATVTSWQIEGSNPTFDPGTLFIDEFGYVPPYFTPGYPISPLNPYTGLPWEICMQGAALCVNADGTIVDGCLASNAGYDDSDIDITYLPASDPACTGNPPCTGEFFANDIDPATGFPILSADFLALCPQDVNATGDGYYIPFSFYSDDIPVGPDNITFTGSTLSTSIGTIYNFVFLGSPQIPATAEATLNVALLYLSPADIASGTMPTITFVDATGACTITVTIDYLLPDDPTCSGMGVAGCVDDTACNYDPNATIDDGSCTYPEANFDCDGNCLVDIDCAGECGGTALIDCAGVCGGTAEIDCEGTCGGTVQLDCAGTCGGTAQLDCAGDCEGTAVADCAGDCGGSAVLDCAGVCGGTAEIDCEGTCGGTVQLDCTGTCGGSETEGTACTDANGNAGVYNADCNCVSTTCEEEISGVVTSPDPLCDLLGINIIITASDGTSITVTVGADGSFMVPGGPFPCGMYTATFEDVSMLPTCYTNTGSTDPINFELDGDPNTMDGPGFNANPAIPTLSQWGLIILTLLSMSFGAIQLFISFQSKGKSN